MQDSTCAKIKNQQKSVDRIKGQPERVGTGIGDGHLPNQFAIRLDDVEHGVPTKRAARVEAET